MIDAHIQNELSARVGLIGARLDVKDPRVLACEIDQIRAIAHRSGMRPAVTVAQALEMALARGERGPLIHGWLNILRDAVSGDRHDAAACDTYRAACAVRMFG